MSRRLASLLALAAGLAACTHNSSSAATTIEPAPSSTNRAPEGPGAPGGPAARGGRGGFGAAQEMLLRGITLSADQQQRVDSIRASYRTQMEASRNQSSGDREAMRGQMRTMMEKQQADIRAVLTADQQAQFDRNVAEIRSRMEQGRGGRPGPTA
jgi:Spy/CpxP family protein refolding chaperone